MTTTNRKEVTASFAETLMFTTGPEHRGITVQVSGSTLGGGTLTLSRKPINDTGDAITLDTLTISSQYTYDIGGGQAVYLTLTGATSPSATILIDPLPA